jgi:hypothetical protein
MKLGERTLAEARDAAARFIDPILRGPTKGHWDPISWSWW